MIHDQHDNAKCLLSSTPPMQSASGGDPLLLNKSRSWSSTCGRPTMCFPWTPAAEVLMIVSYQLRQRYFFCIVIAISLSAFPGWSARRAFDFGAVEESARRGPWVGVGKVETYAVELDSKWVWCMWGSRFLSFGASPRRCVDGVCEYALAHLQFNS